MLDPELTEPDMSCRVVAAFVPQLADEFGPDVQRAVLADAGLPVPYLLDPSNWVSVVWVQRFVESLARHGFDRRRPDDYDDELWQFWRRNGQRAAAPENFGALFSVVRSLGSPVQALQALPRLTRTGNRHLRLDVQAEGQHVHLVAHYEHPGLELSALCWNIRGLLERVPCLWGLPPVVVEHPVCAARDGAACCEYRLVAPRTDRRRALRSGAAVAGVAGLAALASRGLGQPAGWAAVTAGAVAAALLSSRDAGRRAAASAGDSARALEIIEAADRRAQELWDEGQELRRALLASQKLSGYLHTDVVETILDDPEQELALGGTSTHAAVLFADIVGFTPRCEGQDPAVIVDELNLYFGRIDPLLEAEGGVIDKRIGDAVMAVFPERDGEAPCGERAVAAGLAMLRAMDGVNAALTERGSPPMAIRVGVAAGPLVQGNMGSDCRLEYTVIGDTVNAAARLEGQARAGHLVVLRSALGDLDAYRVVDARTIAVKGKSQPLEVVELAP